PRPARPWERALGGSGRRGRARRRRPGVASPLERRRPAVDLLKETLRRIRPADTDASAAAQAALDAKTKPRGSLGRLEELACRIAAIRADPSPGRLEAVGGVAAADHVVALDGVIAY